VHVLCRGETPPCHARNPDHTSRTTRDSDRKSQKAAIQIIRADTSDPDPGLSESKSENPDP
jgi:hypothetical protein